MSLEAFFGTYGYPALLVGTFFEGETFLVLAVFAASLGYLDIPWVILVAFAGTLSGDQRQLEPALEIVLCHQERWDGTGYPRGLRGEEIPLGARIFAVVDTFDAMTSDRPYRAALTIQDARDEIRRCSGLQFDPRVSEAFLSIDVATWRRIRQQAHDPAAAGFVATAATVQGAGGSASEPSPS